MTNFLPNELVAKLAQDEYWSEVLEPDTHAPVGELVTAVQMARLEIVKELRDLAEGMRHTQEWPSGNWATKLGPVFECVGDACAPCALLGFADELERAAMEEL